MTRTWPKWWPFWCCEKVGGLELGGPGRLFRTVHRRKAIELISEAYACRMGLVRACGEIHICLRILKCWLKALICDVGGHDRRIGIPRRVLHRLSEEECQRILLTLGLPRSS